MISESFVDSTGKSGSLNAFTVFLTISANHHMGIACTALEFITNL